MRRSLLLGVLAAAAVAVYVAATVLGGLLEPEYSHRSMHISALTSSHAPDRTLLAGLYAGYNAILAAVGIALPKAVTRSRPLIVASWSLILTAVLGVLLVTWFPQDSYGVPATTAGTVHIALAGIAALLTVVAMVAAGRAFQADPGWRGLARPSMLAAALTIAGGAAGAVGTAVLSPSMGLLVRLPIGTFLLWLAAVSWFGLRRTPAPHDLAANAA